MLNITGAMAALITPYDKSGNIDTGVVHELVQYQIQAGLKGFLVAGSTGEGLLLSMAERQQLAEAVLRSAGNQASVVVHVGALATRDAITLAQHAESIGAPAVAAIPPIYFRGGNTQVVDYYRQIAASVNIPVYAYHVPTATGVNLYREIMAHVARIDNVVGMKYTDANLDEMQYVQTCSGKRLNMIYGRDEMLVAGLLMGADGGIGSTYNIMPTVYAHICAAVESGDWQSARDWQAKANRVIEVLKQFRVFASLKAILVHAGFAVGDPRGPIEPLRVNWQTLHTALDAAGYYELPGVAGCR